MYSAAVDGHCDAFAQALSDILQQHGVVHEFVVVERERVNRRGKVVDENPMSHVLISAFGTTWDIHGADAFEAWEESWIQPGGGEEDIFGERSVTPDELEALRQRQDQRSVDPVWKKKFKTALARNLGIVSKAQPAARRRPGPR